MKTTCFALALAVLGTAAAAQELPARWDELTASDWPKALEKSASTCILPIGILEKHGPHAPIGSDLIHVREWSARATNREYAVVFPDYFYGQIYEARHQPGTFALPPRVVWDMLEATCDEIGRNGFKKIVIVNGHGGNTALIQYFAQTQLDSPKDYVVYSLSALGTPQTAAAAPSRPGVDGHAGEGEIANLMASRPELAHPERSSTESGADLSRLELPDGVYTAIWWYARFPNHYGGDSAGATAARGEAIADGAAARIANAIRAIKRDETGPRLQREFFERAAKPRL